MTKVRIILTFEANVEEDADLEQAVREYLQVHARQPLGSLVQKAQVDWAIIYPWEDSFDGGGATA